MNNTPENTPSFIELLAEQGLTLPYCDNLDSYHMPLTVYGKKISNRIGIQPLEGFDSDLDGSPTDMVRRRYLRFVKGGAGLIWFEACAVSDDGKSNPYQMALTDNNVEAFKSLIELMDNTAKENNREPAFKVLQLTHSGRMSRDKNWNPIPLGARYNYSEEAASLVQTPGDEAILSGRKNTIEGSTGIVSNDNNIIASDDKIREIIAAHVHAAELAFKAGFDAVDIKVCHGYFLSELLSGFNRPGQYGGSFENRTRALFEIIDGIKCKTPEIGIAVRLNAFDSVPAPYGYGIKKEGSQIAADLSETIKICKMLENRGVKLINISASSPSSHLFGPEPTDTRFKKYISSTDLITAVKILKHEVPGITFMCTGLSTFKEFGAGIGAGGINDGWFDIAGFGRQALAYPDFANDILSGHGMDESKCCIGCYNCFKLMDPGHTMTGCIVKDSDIYLPLYKQKVLQAKK